MNRAEALKALHEGKKVIYDDDLVYAYNSGDGVLVFYDRCGVFSLSKGLIFSDNYEIYKETKKVKLYQFVREDGEYTIYSYTEDLSSRWRNGNIEHAGDNTNGWIKTNNFIEVEVEQ